MREEANCAARSVTVKWSSDELLGVFEQGESARLKRFSVEGGGVMFLDDDEVIEGASNEKLSLNIMIDPRGVVPSDCEMRREPMANDWIGRLSARSISLFVSSIKRTSFYSAKPAMLGLYQTDNRSRKRYRLR